MLRLTEEEKTILLDFYTRRREKVQRGLSRLAPIGSDSLASNAILREELERIESNMQVLKQCHTEVGVKI